MQNVTTDVSNISASQWWEFLQQKDSNMYLIDTRSPEEWKETGIADLSSTNKETLLISWNFFTPYIHHNDDFLKQVNQTVPNKEAHLFFICKSGGRSAQAANAAAKDGYKNCYNVIDGFVGNSFDENLNDLNLNGWINSKLPRKAR